MTIRLTFVVRDITGKPYDYGTPNIIAESEGEVLAVPVARTGNAGEHAADLVFSQPGNWSIRFNAFSDSSEWESSTIPQLAVIAPGSPAPPTLSQAALGERLYQAKDCTHCHSPSDKRFGPYPLIRRYPDARLEKFLADPKSTASRDSETYIVEMPNLDLTQSEIAALVAYLN